MAAFTYTNPTVGGSEGTWGTTLNANWTALGTFLGTLDSAELAVLDGITATTAELNLLDGVTATTAQLNRLDGITATTAELNYVDGVTSPIQAQLDAKASTETQSTATWQSGTGTTQSLVSPANVKAAILALQTNYSYTQPTDTGAVGTYATAGRYLAGSHSFIAGSSYAGSGLKYGGAAVAADTTNNGANQAGYPQTSYTTMSGTWRAMGGAYRASSGTTVTTFLRIA